VAWVLSHPEVTGIATPGERPLSWHRFSPRPPLLAELSARRAANAPTG
jgi:hypothetical protein